jgi:hypothetical protein
MEHYAICALKWDEKKYSDFKERILAARHKFIGHYDGETAGFRNTSPGVSVRTIPSANLSQVEIEEFRLVVMAMILYFQEELLPDLKWPQTAQPDEKDAGHDSVPENDC